MGKNVEHLTLGSCPSPSMNSETKASHRGHQIHVPASQGSAAALWEVGDDLTDPLSILMDSQLSIQDGKGNTGISLSCSHPSRSVYGAELP